MSKLPVIAFALLVATQANAAMPTPADRYIGLSNVGRNNGAGEVCLTEKASGRLACHDRSVWVDLSKQMARRAATAR